ncbi:HEAT repeat domain-containing protein [Laspinema palackyanum]|uniref:HEAT repeat domain-containing protein n=1 Tax=Laspinema palackyanum TaxID=3231601 RepID=UPI00345D6A9B|nr:HEAT repeat domain-containing protein [Laspinema sp. D2c]
MGQKGKKNTVQAHQQGIQKLAEAKAAQRDCDGNVWTDLDIAVESGFSEKSVERFCGGHRVLRKTAISICTALGLDVKEVVDLNDWNPPTSDEPTTNAIDWREVCETMLNRRLSSNLLTANEDINFNLDDIHVPLALVERRQRDKRPGETRAEDGSQLYEPTGYEEKQRFEHQQFLDNILGKGEGKTKGRQIAIIGEPGAGKTTQLQKIADWILEERPDLPIWISLADLQGRELGDYLLETWLKQAIPPSRLSEQVREDFLAQLEQGRVWLLLDGVDEMATERATAGLPLQQIATQLKGWIASARVVLTCRVNVWEANLNALEAFETYRMLNFNYPTQVEAFIGKWFEHSDAANGEALRQELAKAEYQRLQDLVKNPLRLTLLCSTWQTSEGLPETQAALYKRFVGKIYQWKQNYFPTTEQQRQQLNQALGELARQGIDDAASPFRLRHQLVAEVLGDCDDDKSLFALALQLGWLNQVGVAAEDPDEKVYAFYHATFQEYFAALSLEDWDFFLPREHCDRPVPGKRYRIFDPLWKQTILLWLGRKDIEKKRKEEFIERLVTFEDGCGEWENQEKCDRGFYEYRAYFLVAAGIAEFKECDQADDIVPQIVELGFGYFNEEKQEWWTFLAPIESNAITVLAETERTKAMEVVVNLITNSQDEYTRMEAASSLGRIDPGNLTVIAALAKLIANSDDEYIRREAAISLYEIDPDNPQAIAALVNLMADPECVGSSNITTEMLREIGPENPQLIATLIDLVATSESEYTPLKAARSLGKMGQGNPQAISVLIHLLATSESEYIRMEAAQSLGKIGAGNRRAIAALVNLIANFESESIRRQAASSLGEIGAGNPQAIAVLIHLLATSESESIRMESASSLGEIGAGNQQAIAALVNLIAKSESESIRRQAAYSLGKIDPGNHQAITALVNLIAKSESESIRRQAAQSLGKFDPGNHQAITALVERMTTTTNEDTRREAAENLGKIDPGNQQAINTLVNLVKTATKEYNRREAAYSLGKIDSGNQQAITSLVNLVKTTSDEDTRRQAVTSLGKIGTGNHQAVTTLIQLIEIATDEYTRSEGAESLQKIVTTNQNYAQVIYGLKRCFTTPVSTNNPYLFKICYSLIWDSDQKLSYPEFYRAWHGEEDEVEPEPVSNLPQRLHAKLEEMGLSSCLQLICIDGSKFIDKDNPAAKIYNEMRRANCPKSADGTPRTMADLQSYWDELTLESEQPIALVFYNSLTAPELSGFSERFLQDLSKFEGAICVVTEARVSGLQTFSASQGNWFADMVNWMRGRI